MDLQEKIIDYRAVKPGFNVVLLHTLELEVLFQGLEI